MEKIEDVNGIKHDLDYLKTTNKEYWFTIPIKKGYHISNLGRVKSLKKKRVRKDRILRCNGTKNKYVAYIGYNLHQLLAVTFLGHVIDGHNLVVDHIDNDPRNNKLTNLQLITNGENTRKNWHDKERISWLPMKRIGRITGGLFPYCSNQSFV